MSGVPIEERKRETLGSMHREKTMWGKANILPSASQKERFQEKSTLPAPYLGLPASRTTEKWLFVI